jgi:hypothetical protein
MQTFKRLGCQMERHHRTGNWQAQNWNAGLSYLDDTGANKGAVMAAAIKKWAEEGRIQFVKGKGWVLTERSEGSREQQDD